MMDIYQMTRLWALLSPGLVKRVSSCISLDERGLNIIQRDEESKNSVCIDKQNSAFLLPHFANEPEDNY